MSQHDDPSSDPSSMLRTARDANWDADDEMDLSYVLASPLGRAASSLHRDNPIALQWICFFVARRAVACWDFSCDDTALGEMVHQIAAFLSGSGGDLATATTAILSPDRDCSSVGSDSAADSVAHAARYLKDAKVVDAIYALSSADIAYDHVLTDDRFRDWLIDVAIPVGIEHREMRIEERSAVRISRFGCDATLREPTIGEQGGADQPAAAV